MLKDFDRANEAMVGGRPAEALPILEDLVRRSPGHGPFLSRLSDVQAVLGRSEEALATVKEAIALNPRLDFLHLHLANTYKLLGRFPDARAEYQAVLALNPRMSPAWLALGELAKRTGQSAEERRLLERAVAAGTSSAAILARLAQIETAAGELDAAERHAAEATSLVPEFAAGWWVSGDVAQKRNSRGEAIRRYEKAVSLGFGDARAYLELGKLLLAEKRADAARRYLERAATAGSSPAASEARRLLSALP